MDSFQEKRIVDKHPDRINQPMAVKILPNIYLGDSRAAYSDSFFEKANIQGVLNMTPNIDNRYRHKDIEYLKIPVYDSHAKRDVNKMYQYFPVATEFMYKNSVMENKNILVHCALGRQRSCAAIAAYLMKFYKMSPMVAMEFIIKRKSDAFHYGKSANFAKPLNKWYSRLYPEDYDDDNDENY